jgi:hypothetical protein
MQPLGVVRIIMSDGERNGAASECDRKNDSLQHDRLLSYRDMPAFSPRQFTSPHCNPPVPVIPVTKRSRRLDHDELKFGRPSKPSERLTL